MEKFVYLVIGWLLGVAFGVLSAWMKLKKLGVSGQNPAKSGHVVCGACQSVITERPSNVVLTGTEAFRYYRCLQCGTTVVSKMPDD
jgi:hypothetical protein